jgi:hypothetical protein
MTGAAVVVTLDTCCVSAIAHDEAAHGEQVEAIGALIDLARVGRIGLQVTTAYERDFERLRDEGKRSERLAWLSTAPVIDTVGGVLRWDVSVWDGLDVWAGDDEAELADRVRAIVAPGTMRPDMVSSDESNPGRAAKAFSDTDHLIAHAMSAAAWFATIDTKTILCHRAALAEIGVHVALPSEILAQLAR